MSYGINSYYQNRLHTGIRPAGTVRPATSAAAPEQAAAATRTAGAPAAQVSAGLNPAEQQMIDRYFPASDQMTSRLYGPGQAARTLNAGRVGGRLDLQG